MCQPYIEGATALSQYDGKALYDRVVSRIFFNHSILLMALE